MLFVLDFHQVTLQIQFDAKKIQFLVQKEYFVVDFCQLNLQNKKFLQETNETKGHVKKGVRGGWKSVFLVIIIRHFKHEKEK